MLAPSQIWGSRNRAYSLWVRDPLRWASQQKSQALLQRVVVEQLSPQLSGNAAKKERLGISYAVKTQFHSHTTHKTHFRSAPEQYQVWPLHDLSTYFVFFRSTFLSASKKIFSKFISSFITQFALWKKTSFCFVDLHKAHLIISIVMGKFADGFEVVSPWKPATMVKRSTSVLFAATWSWKTSWKSIFRSFTECHPKKSRQLLRHYPPYRQ